MKKIGRATEPNPKSERVVKLKASKKKIRRANAVEWPGFYEHRL